MSGHTIAVLSPDQALSRRDALIDLLVDSVEDGASVGFVWPMTRAKAEAFWDGALAAQARGEVILFVAEAEGQVQGTVQLIPSPKENQAFRADLAKMLVHRRARRRGLGKALLATAEAEARRIGRTLLTLDTETDSAADCLYAAQGWSKFGEVPEYATSPDKCRRDAVSFFYKAL